MKLKAKLSYGLGFLFLVILSFGILGIFYINRLSRDAEKVLKNNYESLVYLNNMSKALEDIPQDKNAQQLFIDNLKKQENNITEPGEKDLTQLLQKNFDELIADPRDSSNYSDIRKALHDINDLNQQAIFRKYAIAQKTAEDATFWLTIIFTILSIIAFTIVVNFPSVIASPIKALSAGIRAIAEKDYSQRIHLKQNDEFGELAHAFNSMAEKLEEYEHSNLDKLMFEKRRIEAIINQMKDAIIGFDGKKKFLFLNAFSETLLGLKEIDVEGKYAPDIALRNDLLRTLLLDEEKTELKIYANGKESYFIKEHIPIKNEETLIGEVIVLRNITPFHELDEAKTNFIATVSHELKTPVSSILMSAGLLQDERIGNINEEQKQLVNNVKEDCERLLRITGELLKMTQVEAGKIQMTLEQVHPNDILKYAIDSNKMHATQHHIHIDVQTPSALPNILADKEKIEWVLANLISNAIRYSYERSTIIVAVEQHKDKLLFSVKDFGKGIDEKYRDKIFDKYFRIPGSKEGGTGLGLAICKEFIEAQNGTISVDSNYGEGSKFSFELNIAE
jgi:PAS domain S-box-containing protein